MREAQNLRHVEEVMENDFGPSLNEFAYLNDEVAGVLPEDEKISDQELWFASKMAFILDFMKETKNGLQKFMNLHCKRKMKMKMTCKMLLK